MRAICIAILFGSLIHTCSTAQESGLLIRDGESIAFLGDSITAGGEGYGGYCRLVMHGLRTRGIRAQGIYAGIPGNKSYDMLLRLASVLRQKPDHLFLSVGVNDVWHTDPTAKIGVFQPAPGMGTDLEHFKIYIPRILDRCKAAGTKVILSTFTQITEDPEFRLNKKAVAYNDFLKHLAKERNLPIAFLNEAAFARIGEIKRAGTARTGNVISSDGIHPTSVGHRVMARGVLKAIGFKDTELAALEGTWTTSPQVIGLGTRQVTAGGRQGGWYDMLLGILNEGDEPVTARNIASLRGDLATLAGKLKAMENNHRACTILLVPPIEDGKKKTPAETYRKSLRSVIESAKGLDTKLIITTIPMFGRSLVRDENTGIATLNTVIRETCKTNRIPLADIWAAMQVAYSTHPDTRLIFNEKDERLNHTGNKLFAEVLAKAMGLDLAPLAEWRRKWDHDESYTFHYTNRTHFSLHLTPAGSKVLKEVSNRFHQLEPAKILSRGIEMLLHEGEPTAETTAFADGEWFSTEGEGSPLKLRRAPKSLNELRTIRQYCRKHNLDAATFYQRAFKVALYALRTAGVRG